MATRPGSDGDQPIGTLFQRLAREGGVDDIMQRDGAAIMGGATIAAGVIVPLRTTVRYRGNGKVGGTTRWLRTLSEGGRLHGLLGASDAAGQPFTWLVDPAVLDAVSRLAAGNPPRTLAPDPSVPGQEPVEPPAPEAPAEPGVAGSAVPSVPDLANATPDDMQGEKQRLLAGTAATWLERFRTETVGRSLLALPYGDLDVSAAVRHDPQRYLQALERSGAVMTALGLRSRLAVVPHDGLLSPEAIEATPPEATIILSDTAFAVPPTTDTSMLRLLKHRILITSTGAESGGPAPTAADDPLAVRQRLLSEAALRLDAGSSAPVVLTVPTDWDAGDMETLFEAFDTPWLDADSISQITALPATGSSRKALDYTDEAVAAELSSITFATTRRATDTSALLEEVLTLQSTVEVQVLDELLTNLSELHRPDPLRALESIRKTEATLRGRLASIRVQAPTAITLSSDTGPLGVTLVNGLDQPVSVALQAEGDEGLSLRGTTNRDLAPGARTLVRFEATAEQTGMHQLDFVVTSQSGVPLGSSAELPVRASSVSGLIWVVMAAGAALLFGAIAMRLVRRARRARRPSPDDGTDEGTCDGTGDGAVQAVRPEESAR